VPNKPHHFSSLNECAIKKLRKQEYQIGIVNEKVDSYLSTLMKSSDPILLELEKDASKRDVPIIGPHVARVITMLLKSAKPEKALEVGTATGYSGICIARTLEGKRRKLTTIEMDPNRVEEATKNFQKARLSDYVEILQGNAREIVPYISKKNQGGFDVVFLDVGDKTLYVDLFKYCISALRIGGFFIADNTLWGGAVAIDRDKSPETTTIRKFNRLVFSDNRLDAAVIPLRDGFTAALKIKE
jgi:caffeoyl-CoA O-methyltransferase